MAEQVFVARERELAQLNQFLDKALSGQGQVCFVTGEAGSGKTAMVTEFARRAQNAHAGLVVAVGQGDAQTGVGDPYLPFREVLGLLTGDVEAKLAQGAITQENAGRLRDFLRVSGQALVDLGPDLVDIFVPGVGLATRAGAFLAGKVGWLDRLEELRTRKAARTGDAGLEQSHIFEQYTNVLTALAVEQPLMLVVDDLQWADAASINLLFRLGRRIKESRILIVGAYRPDDVALGRGGERHPLKPVVNELKRYFGDIWVDLGRAEEAEGHEFVDALLDREPNRLGEGFRQALYRHTGGHPLFTVELLRDMQERGDLVQDEEGRWVEGPTLEWGTLPARVEGVIGERIGRLEGELRKVLTVASVEGEDFTAEVVARVQAADERGLVRRLSGELEKQHRLVRERGMQRLGRQRLSLYRFQHHLFQKYLYNSLGEVERAYLHEDVGNVLEALYGDQAEEIAVQLARHFLEAGLDDKALPYLIQAGDAAARQYANTEAVAHYSRALEVARRADATTGEQITHLYTRRGRALELNSQFEEALANYEEMEKLGQERGDRSMELAALVCQGQICCTATALFNPELGEPLTEQALQLAGELGDRVAEARILWNMLNLYQRTGRIPQALDCGGQSLAIARELELREQLAYTLNDLSPVYQTIGRYDRAKELLHEASSLWRELGNQPMLADSLATSCGAHVTTGDYELAVALSEEAFQVSQSINNLWGQSYSRMVVGHVYWDRGEPDRAIEVMEESILLGEQAGFVVPGVLTRSWLAVVYGSLGAIERGIEIAHLAVAQTEAQVPQLRPYALAALAHLHLQNGDPAEAAAALDTADTDSVPMDPVTAPVVMAAKGQLALAQHDYEQALTRAGESLAGLRQSGVRPFIPEALYGQGQALLAMGQTEEARESLLEARAEAEALGSRRMLWQILSALSKIEAQRGNTTEAEDLRQGAQEIVEFIADHAGTPELRASFLTLPDVRAVIDDTHVP